MNRPADPRWRVPAVTGVLLLLLGAQGTTLVTAAGADDALAPILAVIFPAAWTAAAGFVLLCAASLGYLWTHRPALDLLAAAAAEVGALLAGLALVLGALWSRPASGLWWTWSPHLTTTAVVFVLLGGYLVLRAFVDEEDRRARWSAAVAVLACLNVPIVYVTVRLWPDAGTAPIAGAGVPGLVPNLLAFSATLLLLTGLRYRIALDERTARSAAVELALRGGTVHV